MHSKTLCQLFCLCLFYSMAGLFCLTIVGSHNSVNGQTKTMPMKSQLKTENTKESPFACNISVLTKQQRTRTFSLLDKMKNNIQEVKELTDGYAFRFPMEAQMLMEIGEFITYERLCCPFFDFELAVEREGGPMWLRLKGREGVKDFIRMEFGL